MDGWMDGWVGGWDGWDVCMDDVCIDGWVDG